MCGFAVRAEDQRYVDGLTESLARRLGSEFEQVRAEGVALELSAAVAIAQEALLKRIA